MKPFGLLLFVGCALAQNGYNYPQTEPLFPPPVDTIPSVQQPVVPSPSVGLPVPNFNVDTSSEGKFVVPVPLEIQNLQKNYIPPAPVQTISNFVETRNTPAVENTYVPPAPQNTFVPPAPQNTYVPPAPQNTFVPPAPQTNIAPPLNTYGPPTSEVNFEQPQQNTISLPTPSFIGPAAEAHFEPPQQNTLSLPTPSFIGPQTSYSSPPSGPASTSPQDQSAVNTFAPNQQTTNNNNLAPHHPNPVRNNQDATPIFEENMDINHRNPYTNSLAKFIPHYKIPARNPNAPPAPTYEEQQTHEETLRNLKFISANFNYNLFNYTTTTPAPDTTIEPLTAPSNQLQFNYQPMNVQGQSGTVSGPMTVNLDYAAATIPNVRPGGSPLGPLNKYLPSSSYQSQQRPARYQVFAPVKSRELYFSHH